MRKSDWGTVGKCIQRVKEDLPGRVTFELRAEWLEESGHAKVLEQRI